MKILHLETALEWRGGQQQIAYLVHGLLQNSIETLLLCPKNSELHRRFNEQKFPVQTFKFGHHLSIFTANRIAQFIKKQDYDILHVHSSHALSLGLLVKLLLPSLKLVASRRVDFSIKKPVIGALKYNNSLIDRMICVSHNIANVLKKDGVSEARLTVIHDGIDLNRFSPVRDNTLQNELEIPDDYLVVGTVAALVGHKDYPTLLKAAAIVVKDFPKVTFCAVGDGSDRKKLFALHRQLGLGDRFKFVGFRQNLERFFSLFNVFVLASYLEGLGSSVLDALSFGLPVVASRAGGIPEIIEHGKNGLLVPPKNSKALAKGILKLLKDAQLRQLLGEKARQSVQNFTIEHTVQKHIQLYHSLLFENANQ